MHRRILLCIALIAALAGYFGPWVWHPAVAFRYSADDLSEFVKLMPAVRFGQVAITRELFFLPIWLVSIGLALWLGRSVRSRAIRALTGAALVYAAIWPMPRYPFILDAYQSTEYGLSFWASVVAAILCVVSVAFGARLPARWCAGLWIGIGAVGASVAPLHFVRLKPELDKLHGWAMDVGWGIFAVVIGFLIVAAIGVWEWRSNK